MTLNPTQVTRRLVLLRHAKAEPAGTVADTLRPLALTGRKQAARVGPALVDADVVPELVLCSDAVRTRQTWDLLKAGLGDAEPEVVVSPQIYSAGVEEILELVGAVDPRVRTVLVVGHEPTMSAVAAYLAGPGSDPAAHAQVQVGVPTAAYSVLESDRPWSQWSARSAVLTTLDRPHV